MFRNYLKIGWRNLWRNKTYAGINIFSIAIGLAAFWMIALYIGDEFSYDHNQPEADRIYRVAQHASWEGGKLDLPITSPIFGPAMKQQFPEVESTTRIDREGGGVISYADKTLKVGDIIVSDDQFFKVFQYDFKYGNPATALSKPNSIVITESLATKIFDDAGKALNKTIYFGTTFGNLVTGVVKDLPENTHLHFSGVRSADESFNSKEWQNFYVYTYIKLAKNASIQSLEKKVPSFAAATIKKEMKVKDYRMELQPLTSIHLHSNLDYELAANGSISRVYMFMAIAVLILLIALINYMNLSTARSSVRVKEVGIRKVIGSGRRHLVGMFITESLVITFIAAAIAFFLANVSLPMFNSIAGKQLTIWRFGIVETSLAVIVFATIIGIISGIYPAYFLSRFKTIAALKGQLGNLQANILFRRSLVVFQFVITVVMITGSFVIYSQMQYTRNKDLGFNKEQTLTFHIDDMNVRTQISALKTQLLKSPLIEAASAAGNPIGNNDLGGHPYSFEQNGIISTNEQMAQELMVDEDFMKTMDVKMVQGRNFSPEMTTDKINSIIINETLLKTLGWKEAIGKKMQFKRNTNSPLETRIVIGVIKDFHTYSLQHKIEPLVMMAPPDARAQDNLYVKIAKGKTVAGLAYLKQIYAQFDKNAVPEFNFLDENFAKQYAAEQKQQQVSIIFTVLAVLIACLGLFGLATFTALQRVKEIGIRKVLGATVASVIILLSKDFLKLVCIATVIAIPLAWYTMDKWLQDFAYRINISAWIFLAAGTIAILIALFTISFQA
ncbi:MAG: ABC transporter permease, partial [Ferruginibacter sp.]